MQRSSIPPEIQPQQLGETTTHSPTTQTTTTEGKRTRHPQWPCFCSPRDWDKDQSQATETDFCLIYAMQEKATHLHSGNALHRWRGSPGPELPTVPLKLTLFPSQCCLPAHTHFLLLQAHTHLNISHGFSKTQEECHPQYAWAQPRLTSPKALFPPLLSTATALHPVLWGCSEPFNWTAVKTDSKRIFHR